MVLEPGREENRKQGAAYPCDKPRHERDGERMSPHVLLPFRPARVNVSGGASLTGGMRRTSPGSCCSWRESAT